MKKLNRRTFLSGVATLVATSACKSNRADESIIRVGPATEEAAGLMFEESSAPTMSDGRPALRVITLEADGSPLDDQKMRTFHARDLHNDTIPQAIVLAKGRARVELSDDEPIELCCRLKVPGFGEVYCHADNEGRGYTRQAQFDFVTEAAKTRLHRVRETQARLRTSGLPSDREFDEHLGAAGRRVPKGSVSAAYESLSHGLHAGERLALNAAKMKISRLREPRKDFLFGVMVSGYDNPAIAPHMKEAFNFCTAGWYWWKDETAPDNDRIDYTRMDATINWCIDNKIVPKGFGYLYMTPGATQPWMRPTTLPAATRTSTTREISTEPNTDPTPRNPRFNERWSYDRIKKTYETIIRQTVRRYHPRLQYCEIMNEAHDKANLWGMTQEQILDMGKMAFKAAREGSPTVKRMMNHCCMWGEYAKRRNADGSRRWTPYRFIKDCFDNGINYETIGLQLYYPQHDIFEIDRMLDRYAVFNRPCHITEIATASQDGLDPESMRPRTYAPGWHGPWSPTLQADWMEQVYTLLYSKQHFECVGWWDVSDVKGHFWPFGGLLDKNQQPKESFHRLKKLQKDWGVAMTG